MWWSIATVFAAVYSKRPFLYAVEWLPSTPESANFQAPARRLPPLGSERYSYLLGISPAISLARLSAAAKVGE
jgi:hypothetical protein